ncbi:MAG: ThuA domain-containing protein [Phycisphaeraceae bacterium]
MRRTRVDASKCAAMAVLFACLLLALPSVGGAEQSDEPCFEVLVFTRTVGYRHASIARGSEAVRELGEAHGFVVNVTEQAADFTDENLGRYDAVIFLSTTGDVLNDDQQAAFERYIQAGHGYVGIHAAADAEYDWPWYGELVGAYFKRHPHIQEARLIVEDREHIATAHLPEAFQFTDEWYDFDRNPRDEVNVLVTLDEQSYDPAAPMGDHPISWYHEHDGGRSWYTGMGHREAVFDDEAFRQHLLGGIIYAATGKITPDDANGNDEDDD